MLVVKRPVLASWDVEDNELRKLTAASKSIVVTLANDLRWLGASTLYAVQAV
jgi:hypothetical protein